MAGLCGGWAAMKRRYSPDVDWFYSPEGEEGISSHSRRERGTLSHPQNGPVVASWVMHIWTRLKE